MANETFSWERLPNETPKAYQAFIIYLELGVSRSVAATARMYKKKRYENPTLINKKKSEKQDDYEATHVFQWSKKYDWIKRSIDYDSHNIKERTLIQNIRNAENSLTFKDLQYEKGKLFQKLALAKLKSLTDLIGEDYTTISQEILGMSIHELIAVSNTADLTTKDSLNIAHVQEIEKIALKSAVGVEQSENSGFNDQDRLAITDDHLISLVMEYRRASGVVPKEAKETSDDDDGYEDEDLSGFFEGSEK